MPKPRIEEVKVQLDQLEDIVPRLSRDTDELLRRSRFKARDGFPASSGGGSGSSSEISNPTANAAIADAPWDKTGDMIVSYFLGLKTFAMEAQRLDNLRNEVMKAEVIKHVHVNEIPDCVNPVCQKPLTGEGPDGRGIAGRCNNCYKYRRTHNGEDRPRDLVEAELRRASVA